MENPAARAAVITVHPRAAGTSAAVPVTYMTTRDPADVPVKTFVLEAAW
ncbi:hypothetical protein [Halobacillus sp. KGW1]|nr:hypothetical protein [Halobacillus sp. KGW1]